MYCLHPQLFPNRQGDMNQLRQAIFGSQHGTPTGTPQPENPATQPSLAVPPTAPSIDGSELDRINSSLNMATEVQAAQPATLTPAEVNGLKEAQKEGQTVACPDPSAHQHPNATLQDHASKAALYVTHPERATNVRDMNPLGPDGKLSSAGMSSRHSPVTTECQASLSRGLMSPMLDKTS